MSESTSSEMSVDQKKDLTRKILSSVPDNRPLMQALKEHSEKNNDHTLYVMIKTLVDALVLIPVMPVSDAGSAVECTIEAGIENRIYSVDEGNEIQVMELLDPQGKRVLPMFTDWHQLRKRVPKEYGAMVRPTRQAAAFALGAKFDGGAVLNPNGDRVLPLREEILKAVAAGQLPPQA